MRKMIILKPMEKISLRIKILIIILALIVVICPFLGGGLTEGFVYEIILILTGLTVFLYSMVLQVQKEKIIWEKNPWPLVFLGLFIIALILSSIFSIRPYNSVSDSIIWLCGIFLFFLLSQLTNEGIIKKFSWLFIIIGGLVSLIGFVLFIISKSEMDLRLDSVLYNPNSLAGYLIGIWPIALVLLFSDLKKSWKILLITLNIIIGTAFILTVSYTGWASMLPILLFIIFYFHKKIFKIKFVLASLISIVIIISALFCLRFYHNKSTPTGAEIAPAVSSSHAISSFTQRQYFLQVGYEIFVKHPITGIGLNNLKLAYQQIQNNVIETPRSTHNNYLDLLVETGLLGLLVFLGFIFSLFFKITKFKNNYFILGLFLGWLGLLMHGAVDFAWQTKIVIINFFVISGLLYGYYLKQTETKHISSQQKVKYNLIIILLLIFSILFIARGVQIFYSNYLQSEGERYQELQGYTKAIDNFQQAWKINKDPELLAKIGILQYTKEDYTAAETTAKQWIINSPQDANAYQLLGRIYKEQNKLAEADEQFTKAVSLNPLNNIEINTDLMEIYLMQKKYSEIIAATDPYLTINSEKINTTSELVKITNIDRAKMLNYLGEAYLALGDKTKAKESWQRALTERPSYAVVQEKINQLEQ